VGQFLITYLFIQNFVGSVLRRALPLTLFLEMCFVSEHPDVDPFYTSTLQLVLAGHVREVCECPDGLVKRCFSVGHLTSSLVVEPVCESEEGHPRTVIGKMQK
jgi:hypothetical protein